MRFDVRQRRRWLGRAAALALALLAPPLVPAARAVPPPKVLPDAFARGVELYKKNDLDAALAAFRQAAEKDPNDTVVQSWIGYVLLRQEKNDEAIACFQKALAL